MDQFSQPVLSKKLLTIIANSSTSTNQISFKRAIASSDKYKLDDLNGFDDNSIKTIKEASETVFSNVVIKENGIQLTAIFSSNGNASDYEINSVLFTAEYGGQEFLAFSQIANYPLNIPAGSTSEVFNLTLKPKIVIDSTKTISTSISPDAIATNEYVEQKSTELNSKIDNVQSEQTDLIEILADKISKTGNPQTVDSKLTFTEKINGVITSADSASSTSTFTLNSGTDLHAITDIGNSTYALKGTYTNAPSDFTGTGILNRSVSGNNVVLTVTDVSTANKWVQTYNGNSWSDWQQGGGGWSKNLANGQYYDSISQYFTGINNNSTLIARRNEGKFYYVAPSTKITFTNVFDFKKYKYAFILTTQVTNTDGSMLFSFNFDNMASANSWSTDSYNAVFLVNNKKELLTANPLNCTFSALKQPIIIKGIFRIPISKDFYNISDSDHPFVPA